MFQFVTQTLRVHAHRCSEVSGSSADHSALERVDLFALNSFRPQVQLLVGSTLDSWHALSTFTLCTTLGIDNDFDMGRQRWQSIMASDHWQDNDNNYGERHWTKRFGDSKAIHRWKVGSDMGVQHCMIAEDVGEIEKYNTDAVDISTHVHHLSGFAFTLSPGHARPRTLRTKQHSAA